MLQFKRITMIQLSLMKTSCILHRKPAEFGQHNLTHCMAHPPNCKVHTHTAQSTPHPVSVVLIPLPLSIWLSPILYSHHVILEHHAFLQLLDAIGLSELSVRLFVSLENNDFSVMMCANKGVHPICSFESLVINNNHEFKCEVFFYHINFVSQVKTKKK